MLARVGLERTAVKQRRVHERFAEAQLHGLCSSFPEAFRALVPRPDFKSGGDRGDTVSAGSIPVRFRHAARC